MPTAFKLLPAAHEWLVLEDMASRHRHSEILSYRQEFREVAKHLLWTMHLLFAGQVHDGKTGDISKRHFLPYRLSKAQREEAREHFSALWDLAHQHPALERTPIAKAKGDDAFQGLLRSLQRRRY